MDEDITNVHSACQLSRIDDVLRTPIPPNTRGDTQNGNPYSPGPLLHGLTSSGWTVWGHDKTVG